MGLNKTAKTFSLSHEVVDTLNSWANKNPLSPSDLCEMLFREYFKIKVPELTIGNNIVETKVNEITSVELMKKETYLKDIKNHIVKPYTKEGLEIFIKGQSKCSEEMVGVYVSEDEIRAAISSG